MNNKAWAAFSADTPLAPFDFDRRALRGDDVAIDILYCGVCHTDLHWARNDWGRSSYPVVPGHEIVGRVSEVGAEVSRFRAGQIVAVGCMVDSCQGCPACSRSEEQFCAGGFTATYGAADRRDGSMTQGGYSDRILVTEKFVLSVPDGMDLAGTAPLLCAGVTTWSPLRHWNAGPESKVAVVGLGGLGHMALKLGKALGAEMTLFTRSPGKEADARRLGADHVVLSTDPARLLELASTYDLIIDTVPYAHDVNPYMPTLVNAGTLVFVGYLGPLEPPLLTPPLLRGRRRLSGSLIGGIRETQEMLDFCGDHGITSDVEVIDIDEINAAFERMLESDVKYRFVINLASLRR